MTLQIPAEVDLSKYIDRYFFGERPHIRGRRVPVATIASNARSNNWGIKELAYQFSLSEAEVLSALLYYEEHQDEIHRQENEESRLFEEMKRLHGDG